MIQIYKIKNYPDEKYWKAFLYLPHLQEATKILYPEGIPIGQPLPEIFPEKVVTLTYQQIVAFGTDINRRFGRRDAGRYFCRGTVSEIEPSTKYHFSQEFATKELGIDVEDPTPVITGKAWILGRFFFVYYDPVLRRWVTHPRHFQDINILKDF